MIAPRVVAVDSHSGRYEVVCGWGVLDELGARLRDLGLTGAAFIISDENVAGAHGERAIASLRDAGFTCALHAIPAGERNKNLDTVRDTYDWLLDQRAERASPIIALGGGVTGDLAGFVAATYLRGVPFVQCPTSLLAMADASIGGKVGVDHARGKNLIGAFYPPRLVLSDPSLLSTMPARALRDGVGEMIKHALIMDPAMLDALEHDADRLLALDPEFTTSMVARNAGLKAGVVSRDERESDLRMILNYGHTTAHALEAVTGYAKLMHGEADSIGMMVAAEIGVRLGVTPPSIGERQARVFERYGLPSSISGIDRDAVYEAMAFDKKVAARRLRWVLLEDLGKPVIRDDVPEAIVRSALATFLT